MFEEKEKVMDRTLLRGCSGYYCCCACSCDAIRTECDRLMKEHARKLEQEVWDAELRRRVSEQSICPTVEKVDYRDLGDAEACVQRELIRAPRK
jgi:hypothetical protein